MKIFNKEIKKITFKIHRKLDRIRNIRKTISQYQLFLNGGKYHILCLGNKMVAFIRNESSLELLNSMNRNSYVLEDNLKKF